MTISYRSSTNATSGSSTFSVSKPTGTADGDFLVAYEACTNDTPAPPSGWTRKGSARSYGGGTETLNCYYKQASGEPSSWTFNGSAALGTSVVCVMCFTNTTATAPDASANNGSTGTSANSGNITTTQTNEMLAVGFANSDLAGQAWTATDYTEVFGGNTADASLSVGYQLETSAGTYALHATLGSSDTWGAMVVSVPSSAAATAVLRNVVCIPPPSQALFE